MKIKQHLVKTLFEWLSPVRLKTCFLNESLQSFHNNHIKMSNQIYLLPQIFSERVQAAPATPTLSVS